MTLTFIIIPFFIVNSIALYQTFTHGRGDFTICGCCFLITTYCQQDSEDNGFCFLVFLLMQFLLFSMVDRYIHELILWKRKYRKRSQRCGENYKKCNCERCRRYREVKDEFNKSAYRLAWVRYAETLLESTPQWCLQVYVMLSQWSFPWYTVLSTVIAVLSLAWSNTTLEKARANLKGTKFNLKLKIFYFFSQLAVFVARLISIATCAYALKNLIFFLLLFCWSIVSTTLILIFCGSMILSCCRGETNCCDSSTKTIFKNFMLTFPLTFYVSETALESLGFSELWIKMFLFVAKSLENVAMLIITAHYSLPHLDVWMPIAWSLLGIGTLSGFISPIARHLQNQREVRASSDANGNEPQVRYVNELGATTATNRAFVVHIA